MPQAVKIKERKRHGRNGENNPGVESIALFDFGMDDSYTSVVVRDDTGKITKAEKVVETEQRGIDLLEEKSDNVEQRSAQTESDAGRNRKLDRENEPDAEQQTVSSDAERGCGKTASGADGEVKKRTRRSGKASSRTVKESGQHEQEDKGRKGRKRETEKEIEFTGTRGDFSETSVIMRPRAVDIGPKPTENECEVEIQMDGVIYRVAAWSVIGNVYHQGLDSRFLVKFYRD